MAIAFVNSGSTSASATSINLTYSSTVGNCLVLIWASSQAAPAGNAIIVDSASNVWVRVTNQSTIGSVTIYVCLNAAAITSVGLSGLTNTSHELLIAEYSGVVDWRVLTNTANATSTTASISSTLNAANNFLVAVTDHSGTNAAYTASVGNLRVQQASATTRRTAIIDNTAASATSVTCSATLTSQPWFAIDIELVAVQNLNIVNLTFGFTNASQNSYISDSIKPVSGDLIIAMCHVVSVTPAAYNKLGYPQITGCGLTFNVVNGSGNSAATRKHWLCWAIADGSATAGTLTFSFPTAPNNAFGWSVERVRGFDSTTPISWCVQIAVESTGTSSVHNPSLTMPALQNSSSLVYAALFTSLADANMTPAAGWTKFPGTSTVLQAMFKVNDNVPSWTNVPSTTTQDLITAVEITASRIPGTSNNPLQSHLLAGMGCGS